MDRELAKKLIIEVARECEYDIDGEGTSEFTVSLRRQCHTEVFVVRHTNHQSSDGWLQVHTNMEEGESYALYSLRNIREVVAFCQVLSTFSQIKSKRKAS